MTVKEEIEAYKNDKSRVISQHSWLFQTPLCASTMLSPQESLSPSVKGMKLRHLSAFPAFLNTQVKDLSSRLRLECAVIMTLQVGFPRSRGCSEAAVCNIDLRDL